MSASDSRSIPLLATTSTASGAHGGRTSRAQPRAARATARRTTTSSAPSNASIMSPVARSARTECAPREKAPVLVRVIDGFHDVGLTRPERDAMAVAREQIGERRSPRPGPDHGAAHHAGRATRAASTSSLARLPDGRLAAEARLLAAPQPPDVRAMRPEHERGHGDTDDEQRRVGPPTSNASARRQHGGARERCERHVAARRPARANQTARVSACRSRRQSARNTPRRGRDALPAAFPTAERSAARARRSPRRRTRSPRSVAAVPARPHSRGSSSTGSAPLAASNSEHHDRDLRAEHAEDVRRAEIPRAVLPQIDPRVSLPARYAAGIEPARYDEHETRGRMHTTRRASAAERCEADCP